MHNATICQWEASTSRLNKNFELLIINTCKWIFFKYNLWFHIFLLIGPVLQAILTCDSVKSTGVIKWIMAELHLAALVSGSGSGRSCWLTDTLWGPTGTPVMFFYLSKCLQWNTPITWFFTIKKWETIGSYTEMFSDYSLQPPKTVF